VSIVDITRGRWISLLSTV